MNQTSGGSGFEFVCLSAYEKEQGLEVISHGAKDKLFIESIQVSTENSKMKENGELVTENGSLVQFSKESFKQVLNNRENRKATKVKGKSNSEMGR